jgi:uncharacterized membrane protein
MKKLEKIAVIFLIIFLITHLIFFVGLLVNKENENVVLLIFCCYIFITFPSLLIGLISAILKAILERRKDKKDYQEYLKENPNELSPLKLND